MEVSGVQGQSPWLGGQGTKPHEADVISKLKDPISLLRVIVLQGFVSINF